MNLTLCCSFLILNSIDTLTMTISIYCLAQRAPVLVFVKNVDFVSENTAKIYSKTNDKFSLSLSHTLKMLSRQRDLGLSPGEHQYLHRD